MRASPAPPPPARPGPHVSPRSDGRASTAIVASVRGHPLLVTFVVLATVLAGVAWSAARERTYEASAQVLLTPLPENGRSLPRLPLLRVSSDRTRLIQTAASLLDAPAAAAATASTMGDGWTAERVSTAVDVRPEGESDVLSVTASASDPRVAARLANGFAQAALDARSAVLRPIVAGLIAETERDLGAQPDASSPVALDLAERLADLRSIGSGGDPTLTLTRLAVAPTSASGPPRWLLVMLSLLAGLAVGVGCALLIDMLRAPRVADAAQAAAETGLPVLARVPALGLLQRVRPSPLGFRPAAATALRVLQHQLELHPETRRRVLFVGVSEGDGGTTSMAEFGLTLARAGHAVLLVDADTRRPGLAARLGAAAPAPLHAVLEAGEVWQRGVVAVPRAPGLKLLVIDAHDSMGIPDDLVAELPRVLAEACSTFDYVLIDAPSPNESGEALQLAAAVDTAVLVVRPGRTRWMDLEVATGMLGRAGRWPEGLVVVGGRGPAPPAAPARVVRESEGAHGAASVTRAAGA